MPEVILVAGRGPMAARAIRSSQQAGAKVVAVYSEADTDALHVRMADESVLLGASAPETSYLDTAALVEAAQVSGAQAVLPVHAVLAGSAELALAIQDAGLLWIGADPDVLTAVHESGLAAPPLGSTSPGSVIGLADGFRIDGVVVRRTRAPGANLCWSSADEPQGLKVDGLPPAAKLLAVLSDRVVELGWQGIVSVAFGSDGSPLSVRGGVPVELGLAELRAGRDLVRAAVALAEDATPPPSSPGRPAAVGAAIRATAVPGEGRRAEITEFTAPTGEAVQWEPGYAAGDSLWSWYDPVLAVLGVPGDDLAEALDAFAGTTAEISVPDIPNDLDQLRERADDVAARLRNGSRRP